MADDGDIAEAVMQRQQRMAHHDDEGATAHGRAVDMAWRDAERLAQERRRMLAGGEDAVDVGDLQAGIGHRVVDRLQMQAQLADFRQGANFVGLVDPDDGDRIG